MIKIKPNIILFVPDSYRSDVLGHQDNDGAVTPHLDALVANDAVSYDNAFSQNPVCTPSRCSFMTGWYPHVHGHRSMQNMLKEHEPNVLSVFKREGYHVWWGGKNDLVQVSQQQDYNRFCDVKFNPQGTHSESMEYKQAVPLAANDVRHGAFYQGVLHRDSAKGEQHWDQDTALVAGAVDMIRNRPADKPFFCYLPIDKPHPPYYAEQDFYEAISPEMLKPRIPTPDSQANLPEILETLRQEYRSDEITEDMWRDVKRIYYAMCSKVDSLFGSIVETLKEQGIYDNTWIFFFSDHGDFTGDYSLPEKNHCTLQDCLLHVPLIIKPPVNVAVKNGRRHHLTELIDITATLYDLLDINPEYTHQGVSLRNSLAGAEEPIHDNVFAEVGSRKDEIGFRNSEVQSMSSDSFYARQSRATYSFHQAGSHAVMCRSLKHKYIRRYYTGHHELFDLEKDPNEMQNVSGMPAYAEIESQMEIHLLDFFMRTGDVIPQQTDSRGI